MNPVRPLSSMRPATCADCRHFNGQPLDIEAALPGLSSLSSAYAAVRSNDGLCAVHDRYVAAASVCAAHVAAADLAMLTDPGPHRSEESSKGFDLY
jgi:hypothetical protein